MSSITEGLAAASCSWPCNGPFTLPANGAFESSGLAPRPVIPHEQFVKTPTTPSGPLSSSLCSAAAREPCYPAAQLDAFHAERPLLILQQAAELVPGARGAGAEHGGPAPSHPQAAAQSADPQPPQPDVGGFCFAQTAMEIDQRYGSGDGQRELGRVPEERQGAGRVDAADAAVREGKWTKEEHKAFLDGYAQYGKSWRDIAALVPTRTPEQIRTHAQKYFQKHDKPKRLKGESMGGCMSRVAAVGGLHVPMSGPGPAAQQSRLPATGMDIQFRSFTLSAPPSLMPQPQPSYPGAGQMALPPHPPLLTLSMSAPSCGIAEQTLETFSPPSPGRFRSMSEGTTLSSTATASSALSILIKELEESQPQEQMGRKVQAEMSDYDSHDDSEDDCQMEEETDESDEDDHLVVMARQPSGLHYSSDEDEDDDEHEEDDDDMELVDALRHHGGMDSASELETEHGFDEPIGRPPQRSGPKPRIREGRWTREEHQLFLRAYKYYGKAWKEISHTVCTRTPEQIRTHAQKYFAKQSRMRTLNRSRGPHGDDDSISRPSMRSSSSSLTSSYHHHGHGHGHTHSSSHHTSSSISSHSHGPRRALSHSKSSSSTSSLSSAGSRATPRGGSPLSTATSSAAMSVSSFDVDGGGSGSSSKTGSPRLTSRQLACAAAKQVHGGPRKVGSSNGSSSSSSHTTMSSGASVVPVSVSVPESMMPFDPDLVRTVSDGGSSSPGGNSNSNSTIRTTTTNESNESEEDLELDEEEMKSLDDERERDDDSASKLSMGGAAASSSSSLSSTSVAVPVAVSTSPRKPPNEGRWTKEEHVLFLEGLKRFGKSWKDIQTLVKTRTPDQIRTHAQKYFIKLDKYGSDTAAATQVSFNGHPLVLMDGRRAAGAPGMPAQPAKGVAF